jgi:formyltetrahydrofolate deformylase
VANYILTLKCADGPGIIHAITSGLLDVAANILEQEQYSDTETGLFFLRTRFETAAELETVRASVSAHTHHLEATLRIRSESDIPRVLIMVSQYDHCLVDLLYRWRIHELPIDIVGVVSNHETCREITESHGLPFHYLPITSETKTAQEAELLSIVEQRDVDLVVLARYMQILSDDFCRGMAGRVINIHHSLLPGFKGAKPYHQAYARGVKLIGATAHFVTGDLDEGPIIEQDVERITHAEQPDDLVRKGRDIERRVLARAVGLHLDGRVIINGSKTVVFRD